MSFDGFKMTVKGVALYIPWLRRMRSGTGGTDSARYCYSVWLRHLALACRHGMPGVPGALAELGPGDSLGVGLSALLSGSDRYYALDVVATAHTERNLKILEELIDLFRKRAPIPGPAEMPSVAPPLDSYNFPSHILTEEVLCRTLSVDRLQAIREALANPNISTDAPIRISYAAPWYDGRTVEPGAVDMALSQATLQHIDRLEHAYRSLSAWVKPGGYMTHQINFGCHHTASVWNGHWAYSDWRWKLLRGGRSYLINRQPHSVHMDLLAHSGFEVLLDLRRTRTDGISRSHLASRFQTFSKEDLTTAGAFIVARKNAYNEHDKLEIGTVGGEP
jgi:hypothetical protein